MATALVLSLALQQLSVLPYPCEVGHPAVFAAREAGAAVVGLPIVVEQPDGSVRDAGLTDKDGKVQFVPESAGRHLFVAKKGETRWVAPLQVVAAPRRWLYAAVCTPLGLALLWNSLRRRRATTEAARA